MSGVSPYILPMRKRQRAHSLASPCDIARPPFPKKLRSQSYPHSTIPLRRSAIVFLQPGRAGRPAIVTRAPRSLARSLRKAAILNCARKKGWTVPSPHLGGSSPENINLEDTRGEADELVARRVQSEKSPLRPSPLGLSNYEEFDQWHGYDDQFDDDDPDTEYSVDREEEGDELYCDFNILDPDSSGTKDDDDDDDDDDDYDNPFSVLPTELHDSDKPPDNSTAQSRPAVTGCSPNWCSSGNNGEVCCR
jgi:hypothetical protein